MVARSLAAVKLRDEANKASAAQDSNHALQEYQMQLMLLEQQNKKRLLMARQELEKTGVP